MSSPISGFSGFNSGLPIDDIIAKLIQAERRPIDLMAERQAAIKREQTAYSNVQSRVSDLLAAIKKLTVRNVDSTSIFDAMTAISSNDKVATATATGKAAPQSLSLEVKSLPTPTRAVSTAPVGVFDGSTTIEDLGVTTGNFTIFVNGNAHTYVVNAGDTMQDLMDAINNDAAVPEITSASIVDGKITFGYAPATTISFGAGGDTSNFLAKTHLNTAVDDGNGTISASQRNTTIALNQVMDAVGNPARIATPVTSGTFTINGVTFDTTGKTLNQIIAEINNNTSAKVTANFNLGNNTLELTAKDTGSTLISVADGTSNFLTAMGVNTIGAQTAGKNTEFVLNGVTMYATSTNVDETIHGMTGVTLNLKQAQPGTTVTIDVQKDTETLKTAIKDIIAKYNAAITYIDQQTDAKSNATLAGESRLLRLRNEIRSLFTSQIGALSGTAYDSLQQAGISSESTGGTASPKMKFDEAKFDAALAADPASVKKLFIGQDLYGALDNSQYDDNMKGTFTRLHQLLSDTTYATDGVGGTSFGALYNGGDNQRGVFGAYAASAAKRLKSLDESIEKAELRLEMRTKSLRQQFLAMDKLVGQMQQQGSAISGLIAQLSNNK